MASAELRAIRRRIRSVESTKKITRAMELIAASRIVKARERVRAARPYAEKMIEVIRNVARASGDVADPLLERRDLGTMGVLVVTSDRGLAGAYNSSVLRMAERHMVEWRDQGVAIRLYAVGKKAQTYFSFRGYEMAESFLAVTDQPNYADARRIARVLTDDYRSGTVDAVDIFYTVFRSALSYVPTRAELLPVSPPADAEGGPDASGPAVSYEYEPDPGAILGRLLPRYVESAIYEQLLESSASEHASRQRAMKAATDNAEELIKVLTRTANQARQAEITTEIAEIVGGAQAMSAS
ncbi:MAG: F0F1 ATP synthase subunit gamma [Acidimicrobiia bacterium]|nr:F0F1 ATP synthase subunit gamma [Acidimicrobiia bacterium]